MRASSKEGGWIIRWKYCSYCSASFYRTSWQWCNSKIRQPSAIRSLRLQPVLLLVRLHWTSAYLHIDAVLHLAFMGIFHNQHSPIYYHISSPQRSLNRSRIAAPRQKITLLPTNSILYCDVLYHPSYSAGLQHWHRNICSFRLFNDWALWLLQCSGKSTLI